MLTKMKWLFACKLVVAATSFWCKENYCHGQILFSQGTSTIKNS